MQIIDACWEQVVLGKTTTEFELEDTDTINELVYKTIQNCKSEHIVVKIPTAKIEALFYLQAQGFYFIETQMTLSKNIKSKNTTLLPKLISKLEIVRLVDSADIEIVLKQLESNLFATDRISLDPFFGPNMAVARYKNWVSVSLKQGGSELYGIFLNKEMAAFVLTKECNNTLSNQLGGVFPAFQGSGLGLSIIKAPLDIAATKNIDTVITKVSTNNPAVLRLYTYYGFQISNIKYVLRQIKNESC